MLSIFVGGTICNAAEMGNSTEVQVKSEVINVDKDATLIAIPFLGTFHPKCVLEESTNEDNQSDISLTKLLPTRTVTFCKCSISNDLVERCKLKVDGLLKRNMPPVHSVPRNILFHSLQINF